jgi:transaldolase
MVNTIRQANQLGQSIWYDNIGRGMIESGELQQLIDLGVSGLTANPSIFEKAISGSSDYDEALLRLASEGRSVNEIYETLAMSDIRAAADLLRPAYDASGGADGYASLEVNPHLAGDTAGTVAEARRFFHELDRPNVLIKVPATPEGIPAIRQLIGDGVNVNVTLIFSLDAYLQVQEAYVSGLEDLAGRGGEVSRVASVASFFVSRVDTAVDNALAGLSTANGNSAGFANLMGQAAVANAKLAYRAFQETFGSERFARLREQGARVQRPLWASTGTKNPEYSDVLYVDTLMGPDTVNTMPDATLEAFLDHGRAALTVTEGVTEASASLDGVASAGVSLDEITAQLLADGVKAFADSFDLLMDNIERKRSQLLAAPSPRS